MSDLNNSVISVGGAVKAIGTEGKIKACVAVFTGPEDPDFDGEYFTAATKFGYGENGEIIDTPASEVMAKFEHGTDMMLGDQKIGTWTKFYKDEFGLWAEGVIDTRNKYTQFLYGRVLDGEMQISGGTDNCKKIGKHLVEFPLDEVSLTSKPCGYKTSVVALKSYQVEKKSQKSLFSDKLEEYTTPYVYDLVDALTSAYYQLNRLIDASQSLNIPLDANKVWSESVEDFASKAKLLGEKVFGGSDSAKSLEMERLRVSIPFSNHSKAVRDTAEGYVARAGKLAELRDEEGKTKHFNQATITDFEAISTAYKAAANELDRLIAGNKPSETSEGTQADSEAIVKASAKRLKEINDIKVKVLMSKIRK